MNNLSRSQQFLLLGGILVAAVAVFIGGALLRQTLDPRSRATEPTATPTSAVRSADFDGSGEVNGLDQQIFLQKLEAQDPAADLDGSGEVNSLDSNLFLQKMSP